MPSQPDETPRDAARYTPLEEIVKKLLGELKEGKSDKDKRRQVEEWLRGLSEKYPEFGVEPGLRDYYVAEAGRLRNEFEQASDLTERLTLARLVESFLDRAAEYDRRIAENKTP